MKRLLRRLRLRWVLLGVTVVLLGLIAWLSVRPASVPVVAVTRRDLLQTVVASGRVRPFSRARLGASITGTVARVAVREGDDVTAGQTLIVLDEADARGAVVAARAALVAAEAAAEQAARVDGPIANARLRQAEANLQKATADYARTADLHRDGVASREQLDLARQSLDVASAAREVARLAAVSLRGEGTQRRQAEAARRQARGSLAAAEARLSLTRITAPADGVVLTRDVEPGDAVQPGRVLMEIAVRADTQLTAEPDEKNLSLLRTGQKAVASADAFPDRRFPARVVYVSPSVDAERGTIEVRLAVDDPPAYLRPDMTVSVEIEIARRQGVLAVPTQIVHEPMSERPWVLVARNGRLTRQDVGLGARGERWLEVVSGLAEGDLVVPVSARGASAGQRARARVVTSDAL